MLKADFHMRTNCSLAEGTIHARNMTPLIHAVTTMTKIKKRVFGR